MAGDVEDGVAGLCLWGRFEAASLLQVQQGFYHVRFGSGGETRRATAAELALPDHPVTVYSAPVDSTVLVPVSDSPTSVAYAHATVLRHLPPAAASEQIRCEVRLEEASGELRSVAMSQLTLPLASATSIGKGAALETNAALFALRGEWLRAQTEEVAGGEFRVSIHLPTGRDVHATVGSGRVVIDGEPADPAALIPGAHLVMNKEAGGGKYVEGEPPAMEGSTLHLQRVRLLALPPARGCVARPVPAARSRHRHDACPATLRYTRCALLHYVTHAAPRTSRTSQRASTRRARRWTKRS